MRVLLVPEVYRPDDATTNGTVRDAAVWVREWLARDPSLHVYWLLPPRDAADYREADVQADRERVTLIEAPPIGADLEGDTLTDVGYSAAELRALREEIFGDGAYLDAVVDQRRGGRFALSEWLLDGVDQWAADVRPFDLIANVHDLQVPRKYRYCGHRDDFQMRAAFAGAAFADGRWFTAGVDRAAFRERAPEILAPEAVAGALADARTVASPIDLDAFEERYAPAPRTLHLAGSLWEKKNGDRLFALARTLHDRYGIETVLTSMEAIPERYRRPAWVDARPRASRETYEAALREGDLAVCASDYETMARTPFEQAASGQVLLLRDAPWVYDCVPSDHPLVADAERLDALAAEAVERWDRAVAANRRLVDHVRAVRSPAAVGERTYRDLRRRVDRKVAAYEPAASGGGAAEAANGAGAPAARTDVPANAADAADAFGGEADAPGAVLDRALRGVERAALDELVDRTARRAADGRPLTDRDDYALTDLVYGLRVRGYEDAGNPGTPVFRPARPRCRWTPAHASPGPASSDPPSPDPAKDPRRQNSEPPGRPVPRGGRGAGPSEKRTRSRRSGGGTR